MTENLTLAEQVDLFCSDADFDEDACTAAVGGLVDLAIAAFPEDEAIGLPRESSDSTWLIFAGTLVFFMHAGFSMLEAGSVRKPNVINIMFKNIGTVAIGAVSYWLFGYGFAYGAREDGVSNNFIGSADFAYEFEDEDPAFFFFQFTFAATAATIVSGAVAERITLPAYFFVATIITGFVFPTVTHWVWSNDGYMSAFAGGDGEFVGGSIGLIDFAGSGVVHATGGFIALVGAAVIGPRTGRFVDGEVIDMPPSSYTLMTLGTFILWFGWYGFNPGSTLLFDGVNTAKAAVTTTLSPCAAGVVATFYSRIVKGYFDLGMMLNCVLGGLVSITAGCVAVSDFAALFIGAIGAGVYIASAKLLEILNIDDPIGASPVHGFCGVWGVISVGIFLLNSAVIDSYSNRPDNQGDQLGMQLVGIFFITIWALGWGLIIFVPLKLLGVLRVDEETEREGLDASEHGGKMQLHF